MATVYAGELSPQSTPGQYWESGFAEVKKHVEELTKAGVVPNTN